MTVVHLTPGDSQPLRVTNAINKNATDLETAQADIDALQAVTHREVLTAARTYYVRTDGSNSNTGLVDSAGGAFLTGAKAISVIIGLDLNGFNATIQFGDGTFTTALGVNPAPVGGRIIINGNGAANTLIQVTGNNCLVVNAPTQVTVQNIKFSTVTAGQCLLALGAGSRILIGSGVELGACASAQLYTENGGEIASQSSFTISGSARYWAFAIVGGVINIGNCTVTLSGTPAWSTTGILFDSTGAISIYNSTFSGSATGKRYTGTGNAVLNSYGAGTAATFFPGNSNGTLGTGAQQL
jgi:hypothetical protein